MKAVWVLWVAILVGCSSSEPPLRCAEPEPPPPPVKCPVTKCNETSACPDLLAFQNKCFESVSSREEALVSCQRDLADQRERTLSAQEDAARWERQYIQYPCGND